MMEKLKQETQMALSFKRRNNVSLTHMRMHPDTWFDYERYCGGNPTGEIKRPPVFYGFTVWLDSSMDKNEIMFFSMENIVVREIGCD